MKYNSPYSTAACGAQAKDWEQGINYSGYLKSGWHAPKRPFALRGSVPCYVLTSTTSAM